MGPLSTEKPLAEGDRGYPRPQLRRSEWHSLNGTWDFAPDQERKWRRPEEVVFEQTIEVPFSPETRLSGIGREEPLAACWYRRRFTPHLEEGKRLILHFGAVDYLATVWIGGRSKITHEGAYDPFCIDITDRIQHGVPCEIVLRAEDDPVDLAKPRGKQDWQPEPHSIWYRGTTGIWQTVWYEYVPETRISALKLMSNLDRWEVEVDARVSALQGQELTLAVTLEARGKLLARDAYSVMSGEVQRRISLSDPGIDDSRNELLWTPESPTLIDATLELKTASGETIDRVQSYTALREFHAKGQRLLLNGRPYSLRLVLDQGYWDGSGLTAPDDQALRHDVLLAKAMGFNGVRKHQKIEDPRYLYWADRLGLLVFEEMPSAYRFTRDSVTRLVRQWLQILERDMSHPCIIAWVPLNESWGVPNLPGSATQQHYVRALYELTKTLDPTRLVLGNDGWESVATDIIGIHDYDDSTERIARRYGDRGALTGLLAYERPGGRALVVSPGHGTEHPVILSEFGGIALAKAEGAWGYSVCDTPEKLERAYTELLGTVHRLEVLSGFCYTQFADTYQEANGLLYADRRPKFPLEKIRAATRGHNARPTGLSIYPSGETFEVP